MATTYILDKMQVALEAALEAGHRPMRFWLSPVDLARLAYTTPRATRPWRFNGLPVNEDVFLQKSRVICSCGAAVAL